MTRRNENAEVAGRDVVAGVTLPAAVSTMAGGIRISGRHFYSQWPASSATSRAVLKQSACGVWVVFIRQRRAFAANDFESIDNSILCTSTFVSGLVGAGPAEKAEDRTDWLQKVKLTGQNCLETRSCC